MQVQPGPKSILTLKNILFVSSKCKPGALEPITYCDLKTDCVPVDGLRVDDGIEETTHCLEKALGNKQGKICLLTYFGVSDII